MTLSETVPIETDAVRIQQINKHTESTMARGEQGWMEVFPGRKEMRYF